MGACRGKVQGRPALGNPSELVVVTSYDYYMVMSKQSAEVVRVAELKARLSEYLRMVRRGHPITVCDRETPIARLVPVEPGPEPLRTRKPIRTLGEVQFPPPLGRRVNSLTALLEERQPGR